MGLENIQLPPIVLQELFKHSLTDVKNEPKNDVKPVPKNLPFSVLGNNRRHILVLIESDGSVHLPDDQLTLLLDILSACSLTMEDVAILNIKNNPSLTYKTVTKELKPEKLFLFGVTTDQIALPLDFPHYQIQRYNNQVYLTAPQLSVFHDNKPEKIRLWTCLKEIFDLK